MKRKGKFKSPDADPRMHERKSSAKIIKSEHNTSRTNAYPMSVDDI